MSIAQLLDDCSPLQIPAPAARTLAGFRAWVTSSGFPEKIRPSFLNGTILIEMSPEERENHTRVKWEVGRVLLNITRHPKTGIFYGDGVLLTNRHPNLSTQPDGMFVTKKAIQSGRLRRVPRAGHIMEYVEFEGTPDVVIEVVSRSSWKKDTKDLPALCHRAGVPEYWLIDALGDEIEFKIFRRAARRYIAIEAERGWLKSPVLDRRFKLVRACDEDGDWQYDLKVKKPT
jgi:Uma2 family endonuclease